MAMAASVASVMLMLSGRSVVEAVPPVPKAWGSNQPNGHPLGALQRMYGNPGYHIAVAESPRAYFTTTVDQESGYVVFAEKDADGFLQPSPYKVGVNSTDDMAGIIEPKLKESTEVVQMKCMANDYCAWKSKNNGLSGSPPPTGEFKNLVLPFRFFNHSAREMNLAELAEDTFNDDHISVKDYFTEQSFGKLTVTSEFADLVELSMTEKECSDNVSGTSKKLHECLLEVVNQTTYTIADYHMVTFIHSGVAAEWGQRDNQHNYYDDRIWSHAWELDMPDGTKLPYAITSAFFGFSFDKIQHVGVPVHEIAQVIGAPTMYGNYPGMGLGLYDVMASPYGFDTRLHHCGSFSAYTKVYMEWVDVEEITEDGTYTAKAGDTKVYKISKGFPVGEYLYIENRQNTGYDASLMGPGLAIYHVDETADNVVGYPAQGEEEGSGNFPTSHYRVSIIQADGSYDLEQMEDDGDATDLFHHFGVDGITPDGPLIAGQPDETLAYPNTNGYAEGKLVDTGLVIKDISAPGEEMQFTVVFSEASSA